MTATEILSRFRRTVDELDAEVTATDSEPETPAPTPEPELEPAASNGNGHRDEWFTLDKVSMSRGDRIKAALKADDTLVLVYAPTQGEIEEVFEALGVIV